jgi:hypothetical protein
MNFRFKVEEHPRGVAAVVTFETSNIAIGQAVMDGVLRTSPDAEIYFISEVKEEVKLLIVDPNHTFKKVSRELLDVVGEGVEWFQIDKATQSSNYIELEGKFLLTEQELIPHLRGELDDEDEDDYDYYREEDRW